MTGITPGLKPQPCRSPYSVRGAAYPVHYQTLYLETILMIFERKIEITPVSQEPLLEHQNRWDNVKKKK